MFIIIDCLIALIVISLGVCIYGIHFIYGVLFKSLKSTDNLKALMLDHDYILRDLRKYNLLSFIYHRDIDGYFKHVWTVHPFASMLYDRDDGPIYGLPLVNALNPRHTFIEGKIGGFEALKHFRATNFLISQIHLYLMIRSLIFKEQISVIQTKDPLYTGLWGVALSWVCRRPLLVHVDANYPAMHENLKQPIMARLFRSIILEKLTCRFVYKYANIIVGGNENNRLSAIAYGAKDSKTALFRIGDAIDIRHFEDIEDRPSAEADLKAWGIEAGNFAIHIGRLEKVKLPDHPVLVIAELFRQGIELKLIMAGGGSMKGELITLARSHGVEHLVIFVGQASQDQLYRTLPYCSLVISPLTGRSLTEAALAGAPIVAYDADWQGEVVITGETGELVENMDWKSMATASKRILEDVEYSTKLRKNIRNHVKHMMEPSKLKEYQISVYNKLVSDAL